MLDPGEGGSTLSTESSAHLPVRYDFTAVRSAVHTAENAWIASDGSTCESELMPVGPPEIG
jgi:hypothetical protein